VTATARLQWSVFEVDLGAVAAGRRHGRRSVVVVSREAANQVLPMVTVLPLVEHRPGRRVYPNEALLPSKSIGLGADAIAMAHQTLTIPKRGLTRAVGSVDDPDIRSAIRRALRVQLNLDELARLAAKE
jgi:mRNA-degrading endonuclease toxin of MazEF toxin-antitoxin module